MNKAAFSRALAGLSSMALLTMVFCPFVARANSADAAAPAALGDLAPPVERERAERCDDDAECVPASCCHAKGCVPGRQRPNCMGVLCSLVCMPGTMDCGQGHCACHRGSCVAVIGAE